MEKHLVWLNGPHKPGFLKAFQRADLFSDQEIDRNTRINEEMYGITREKGKWSLVSEKVRNRRLRRLVRHENYNLSETRRRGNVLENTFDKAA